MKQIARTYESASIRAVRFADLLATLATRAWQEAGDFQRAPDPALTSRALPPQTRSLR